MSRFRRSAIYLAIALPVLLVLAWAGLHFYAQSPQARRLASEKLGAALGLPVEVDALTVGSSQTTIKFRVLQPSHDPAQPAGELLHVENATADLSLLDILTGTTDPKAISLHGAALTLDLSAEGKILTKLPKIESRGGGSLPRIGLEQCRITIRQAGRPDFALQGLKATVSPEGTLNGAIHDPHWGDWEVNGAFAAVTHTGSVELTSTDAPLEMALLKSIPFVPASTWEHVRASGRSAARIHLEQAAEFTYSVEFTPQGAANLVLPDLDTPLDNVEGTIGIAGKKVTIRKSRGELAGGTVNVDGTLDFAPVRSKLQFKVEARGLDLARLPADWALPRQITGQLRGQADLELLIDGAGTIEPRGGGSGAIENARLAGLPAEIKMRLRGDGRRYRFESEAPPEESKVVFLLPPPPAAAVPKPTTLDASITLREVDVEQLLTQLEVSVPYKFRGQVTVNVVAAVPVGGVADRKSYRFKGTFTSPSFFFENLEVRNLRAEISYRDGVLKLIELKGDFSRENGTPGKLQGSATAQVEPQGDLTAKLDLTDIPTQEAVKAVPDLKLTLAGVASGRAELRIPMKQLKDYSAWTGSASLTAPSLTLAGGTIEKLVAKAKLEKGVVTLSEASADLFKGTIAGKAAIPLVSAQPGSLEVSFKEVDSAALTKSVPNFPVPLTGRITGSVNAKAAAAEKDGDRAVQADLDLIAPKMTIRGIPAERLTGKIGYSNKIAEYTLEGHSLGGTFEVKGRYPTLANENSSVHLRNLDLARLSRSLDAPMLAPLTGVINGSFEFASDGSTGLGRIAVQDLAWNRETLAGNLSGRVMLHNGTIDLRDFSGRLAGGRLQGRVRYDLNDPRRNFYNVTLDRAQVQTLSAPLPGVLGGSEGEITLSARGRIGDNAGGTIAVSIANGSLAGLDVTNLELPITWTGGLASGRVKIDGGSARLDNGKITADLAYDYGPISRLSGGVQFTEIRLRKLLGTKISLLGNGRVSGRFDVTSEAVRGVDDLAGTLTATLNQASVREVPLINVVTPFLSPLGLVQPFDSGEIKGRLSKGIFRLDRFALSNAGAQVFAEGSVTLKGRVDLDVVAATGQVGPNTRALKLLGVQVPAFGPLPLTLIARVSDLLSNRTLRLSVNGTVNSPVVQINKAALITDTAARFFLGQYSIPTPNR